MTTIPLNKKWLQLNRGSFLGNLWATFNMDFQSNFGVARVSPRLKVNTSTVDDADLGCPIAFSPFQTEVYAICGTKIFRGGDYPNDGFVEDNATGASADYDTNSDLCVFNNVLASTSTAKLKTLSGGGGTWSDRDTFGVNDEPHKLCYFKKTNRLYYSMSETFINSMDTAYTPADAGDYTLDWLEIALVDMDASANWIWIAGKRENIAGTTQGVVWRWDGVSSQISQEYKIDGTNGIFSIEIDHASDSPVVMGDNGVLYGFNGTGFVELGRLPYSKHLPYAGSAPLTSSNVANRFIHPNGMGFTKNGTLLANINGKNNDDSGTQEENLPSGIWEFSKDNGFVHRQSYSYDPISSSISDFGQNKISQVGALLVLNSPNTTAGRDGTLLAGATLFTNASDTRSVIAYDNSLDTIRKAGYFVTTWLLSDEIEDTWQGIWAIYRRLLSATDKIIFKYRVEEEAPVEATITWVNTTSFTTTTDVSAYDDDATGFNGEIGGEVEILQGTGSGNCRHITNVSESGGTYTVTIDSAVVGVTTGTAKARFQKWIKITPEITGQVNSYQYLDIQKNSPRIQFKVYMEFTGENELHKLETKNTTFLDSQG